MITASFQPCIFASSFTVLPISLFSVNFMNSEYGTCICLNGRWVHKNKCPLYCCFSFSLSKMLKICLVFIPRALLSKCILINWSNFVCVITGLWPQSCQLPSSFLFNVYFSNSLYITDFFTEMYSFLIINVICLLLYCVEFFVNSSITSSGRYDLPNLGYGIFSDGGHLGDDRELFDGDVVGIKVWRRFMDDWLLYEVLTRLRQYPFILENNVGSTSVEILSQQAASLARSLFKLEIDCFCGRDTDRRIAIEFFIELILVFNWPAVALVSVMEAVNLRYIDDWLDWDCWKGIVV